MSGVQTCALPISARLTNSAADCPQLLDVVAEIAANLGELPRELSADAGYCSEANLEALDELGVTAYVATGRMPRSYRCPPSPRGRIPAGLTRRERMKRRLMTKRGRERYRLRQQVVEPVFGQIKNKGLIRIWLRGEEKAAHEWLLHCTGHNLSKLHGCGRDGKPPPGAAQCAAGRTTMWQQHISRAPPLQLQLIGSIPLAGPRPSRLTRAGC